MPYDENEQNDITRIFAEMLDACTKDGGRKRKAGEKVDWRIDQSHEAAVFSHFTKRKRGEMVDPDSGAHPYVHAAWRLLAIAYQETHQEEVLGLLDAEMSKRIAAAYSQYLNHSESCLCRNTVIQCVDEVSPPEDPGRYDGASPVFPN